MNKDARVEAVNWQIRLQQNPHSTWLKWRFRSWLNESPANQQAWQEVEALWQLSAQLGNTQRRAKTRRHWPKALAATFVLTAGTLFSGLMSEPNHAQRQTDASLIWPQPGTDFAVHINARARHVELYDGALYVDVARDGRPFVVSAGDTEVTVLGTAFTVYYQDQALKVEVERGRVQVDEHILSAGQKLVQNPDADAAVLSRTQGQLAPWRDALLVADNQPLSTLLKPLQALYPGRIWVRDQNILALRISGRFSLTNPEQALNEMLRPYGIDVARYWPGVFWVAAKK